MEKAVLFTNYSITDFSYFWDKVQYNFPAKKSVMLIEGLAHHFAKHLAVRELNKEGKNTGGGALQMEMKKAISSTVIEAEDKTKLDQEILNANAAPSPEEIAEEKASVIKEAEDKGMTIDKRKNTETLKKELEEFEGLNN